MLDPHRTLLDARAARRALPELLLGDVVVEQPVLEDRGGAHAAVLALSVHECVMPKLGTIAHEEWRLLHEAPSRVEDDLARAQHLAGDVRGARVRTPAALGARV